MAIRKAETTWTGPLKEGKGAMKVGSGAFDVPFSFGTRFGDDPGTNPEELIGAAQAAHQGAALVQAAGQAAGGIGHLS